MMRAAARGWRGRLRRDDGLTLAEILVAIALAGIAAVIGLTLLRAPIHAHTMLRDESDVENQQLNATDGLYLDVSDAIRVIEADAAKMVVDIARPAVDLSLEGADDKGMVCVRRTWQVEDPQTVTASYDASVTWTGANLVMLTQQFATSSCQGDLSEAVKHEVIGDHLLVALGPFSFFTRNAPDDPMPQPISVTKSLDSNDIFHIVSMSVDVNSRSARMHNDRPMISGAAFGKMSAPGTGVQELQMKAPILRVVTTSGTAVPKRDEGVDAPVLEWTDSTANAAAGWAVYALRYPTGTPEGERGQYRQVGYVINADPTATSQTLTWVDRDIEPGNTAQYVVRAVRSSQEGGPQSNSVMTGVRPAAPALTVTGRDTAIDLSWTVPSGTMSFDLYEDGKLAYHLTRSSYGETGTPYTYAVNRGAGHVHVYQVVAVNRWESKWWCGSDTCQAPVGTYDTAATGQAGSVRVVSNAAAAWTAPVAVTGLGADNRLPADQANPSSSWDSTVDLSWTAPAWPGAPAWMAHSSNDSGASATVFTTGKNALTAAKNAVRYKVDRGATSVRTGLTTASTTDTGASRGATSQWTVTTSSVAGSNPTRQPAFAGAGASTDLLTWPAAATCTATKGASGSQTTRAATVTAARPSGQEVTGTRIRLAGDGSLKTGDLAAWTELGHSATHSWRAQARNGAGYGPFGTTCSATTDVLAITVSSASSTTRSVTAAATATNGTSQTIGLSGQSTVGGTSATWDPLTHGSAFTVTATNSDGFNNVTATRDIATPTVPAPGAPSCSLTVNASASFGRITISGGDQVKLGSSGSAYGSPRSFGSLSAGGYTGYARNTNSDGYNTSYSGWSNCGSGEIVPLVSGNPGPGYSGSDPCNAYLGYAGGLFDASRTMASGNGVNIGQPMVSGYTPGAYQYGDKMYGSSPVPTDPDPLTCAMYRAYHQLRPDGSQAYDEDGNLATWWSSVVWWPGVGGAF